METPPDKDWVALDLDRVGDSLGLQTSRTSERLNQIDRIRANGVGDHIALPQLAVCGDQSAGKSSVLEGITGIPFPRQDGLCTRFATEISLRHEPGEQRATAMIIPHVSRSEEEKARFGTFRYQIQDFTELPNIIERASELMGLRGHARDLSAPAFSADILRLELVGNTGLHLTIVDLPGLISVSENDEDVKLVQDLVDSYLENTRTIILAVVPASSDVDTQGIIQRARHFDKAGYRTVGIITKPDLINAGTESRVARLAKNLDGTKLNLGFFLLKNPTPAQLEKGITLAERRKAELEFFSAGPWKAQGIDPSRIGIDNLRIFLQELLDNHIERELPKVQQDVRNLLNNVNDELAGLGEERSSPNQIRVYLTRISSDFQNLIKAGVEGEYTGRDASFFIVDGENMYVRLRAAVHRENEAFASYMRNNSEKRRVVTEAETDTEAEEGQILVTDEQLMSWIEEKYHETRGRELPGNHNYALLAELYHAQSERWGGIGRKHVGEIVSLVSQFVSHALKFVVKDPKVCDSVSKVVNAALHVGIQHAHEELEKLLQDETRQPITYNHYYTDNIQKARLDRSKRQLAKSLDAAIEEDWNGTFHFQNSRDEVRRLTSSLKERVVVNMTKQACIEARNDLAAYYKVAMKLFVDNVCRQVIERHILSKLPSVFDPVAVSAYDDETLLQLAAESAHSRHRRAEACQLQEALEKSLRDLGN
ncbi:putative dynamin GTPase [Aspergillus clavatus NRRL 1]|uniref:Dynamin family protein n=1 Tax=Aspergillus clavatus (strain ATCC 1007 / CBS 513.65 / DSM 816 / NCTC 3887 / NRRL 1 / QM 1276 / 107) TaxID=344612 RepID=A1CF07_ASPCL|nr:Dynamin family protein [Aspergillus clavatus NRRL 1]EAW11456.1 Dynamin family protein [Aspergillus clavatus NRRL 1]